MALYIASPVKLQTSEWKKDETYFYVQEELDNPVTQQFSFPYVYYCGSYEGCGCGFYFEFTDDDDKDDKRENEWGKRSIEELFSYLTTHLAKIEKLEMFSCWEGDEKHKPKIRRHIDVSQLNLSNSFGFEEDEYIEVFNSKRKTS